MAAANARIVDAATVLSMKVVTVDSRVWRYGEMVKPPISANPVGNFNSARYCMMPLTLTLV
jgi:hypothetical protein